MSKNIIMGCGIIGKIVNRILINNSNEAKFFFDSSDVVQGTIFEGKKVINTNELYKLEKDTNFFIAHNYFQDSYDFLRSKGFVNIFDCINLLSDEENLKKLDVNFNEYDQKNFLREIDWYILDTKRDRKILNGVILKCIDIMVTEKCSMKCQNCSNLMQYYTRPEDANNEQLFSSLDKLMNTVDHLYEVRVIGGEPFMNKHIHKIINKIKNYKNLTKIVVYSNATIIPKNENLDCLKDDRILIEITNYGKELSRNHESVIRVYKENKISFITRGPGEWTDSGTLKYYKRSATELQRIFNNCCVKNTLTLHDGKIFRCPYAANATKLKAIPLKSDEVVDLTDSKNTKEKKEELSNFFLGNKPLFACNYCGGRDYKTKKIKAALQANKSIPYKIHSAYKEKS